MLPDLTLITGGAASGKSKFAERLVVADGRDKIYLATAQANDDEMRDKIARHRDMRGKGWQTIEAPLDLSDALASATIGNVILLDCATLWLTNHVLAKSNLTEVEDALRDSLAACKAPVAVVTNEIGGGVVPDNALARQFRDAQGQLNQLLASKADLVVTVIAGLPMVLKGTLPQ